MDGLELFEKFRAQASDGSRGLVVVPNYVWAMTLFRHAARAADKAGGCVSLTSKLEIRDASRDLILYFRHGRLADWPKFAGLRVQWLYMMDLDDELSDYLETRLRASIASDLWLNGERYNLTMDQIAADVIRDVAATGG